MSPAFCVVMRICVHVGMGNFTPNEVMRMWKQNSTRVVTYKEGYKK